MFTSRIEAACLVSLIGALGGVTFGCAEVGGESARKDGGVDRAGVQGRGVDAGAIDMAAPVNPPPAIIDAAAGGSVDATCATQSAMAETLPLDLFVMVDSSGSMVDPTGAGGSKWDAVKAALTAFLRDPRSNGLGVALQYFPLFHPGVPEYCSTESQCGDFGPCLRLNTCIGGNRQDIVLCDTAADCLRGEQCVPLGMCPGGEYVCAPVGSVCAGLGQCVVADGVCLDRDRCDEASYAAAAVPIATLPAAANSLVASLDGRELGGATPTGPALAGALQAAQAHAAATPGHKVAVLLVTDGLPSECEPLGIAEVATIADRAYTRSPSVPTFVVGVFTATEAVSATTNLNRLASSGGTGTALVVTTNQNVTQSLQSALDKVRTTALACEFQIPKPTVGSLDLGKVNVTFTTGTGLTATIGHVATKDACDGTRGGWYYDSNPATGAAPRSIVACDATCAAFRADPAGKVEIVLGCGTVLVE